MAEKGGKTAKSYARALFEMSAPPDFDGLAQALAAFVGLLEDNPSLSSALASPAAAMADRLEVVRALAGRLRPGDQTFSNFLALLTLNRRLPILRTIVIVFCDLVAEFRRILELQVTSAREVPSAEKAALQAAIERECGGQAAISWRIDPQILGGLVVQAGDTILDSSVRGTMTQLRERLLQE